MNHLVSPERDWGFVVLIVSLTAVLVLWILLLTWIIGAVIAHV